MKRKKVIFRSLTISLYSFAHPIMADVAFQTIYCIIPHRGALMWGKNGFVSAHSLVTPFFKCFFFFLIRFEILISLKLLKFCDKNYFCSKVAYGYKLDIHDKNSSVNATFLQLTVQKMICLQFFDFEKLS